MSAILRIGDHPWFELVHDQNFLDQEIQLGHGQGFGWLACQWFAIGKDFVSLRIHLNLGGGTVVAHGTFANATGVDDGHTGSLQPESPG